MSKCSNVYQPYRKKGFLSLSIYFSKKKCTIGTRIWELGAFNYYKTFSPWV